MFKHKSTSENPSNGSVAGRRVLSACLLAVALALSSATASAWTVLLLCPDEFPGPPDCFDCQVFGDTSALDSEAGYYWSANEWWGPFGYFDSPSGTNIRDNHYHCSESWMDVSVLVRVDVVIDSFPFENDSAYWVTCTAGGGV